MNGNRLSKPPEAWAKYRIPASSPPSRLTFLPLAVTARTKASQVSTSILSQPSHVQSSLLQ